MEHGSNSSGNQGPCLDERHRVAEQHPDHQYVTEFASGRHDDRRTVVADEHRDNEQYRHDTDYREDHVEQPSNYN